MEHAHLRTIKQRGVAAFLGKYLVAEIDVDHRAVDRSARVDDRTGMFGRGCGANNPGALLSEDVVEFGNDQVLVLDYEYVQSL